ncbi:MAG: hypothetical protein KDD99_04365, partial [Bacteroidetes bacterium]|nr:hypothetical protein [Bacteroidota bacterium]
MAHCTQTIRTVLYNLFSKCFLISICLSFIYLPLKAQEEKIVFKKYGVEEGLPEEYVSSIFQDQQGFIWFTTQNGLVKFDGYEFKTYRSTSKEGNDSDLKLKNLNGKMLVGKDGKLWLGGVESPGGIASFDPRTEEFHNYLTDSANSIHYYSCNVMLEDKRGNIWFSNFSLAERTKVLCRLNPESGKLYTYPYSNIFGRYNAVIYSQHGYIAETGIAGSDSTIWILDRAFNLRKWVPEVDTFAIVVPAGTPFPGTGETDKIITIAQNITDELLITGENGLYVWGLIEQKVIKHHTYDPNNSNSLAPGIPRYSFKDHWGVYWVINQNGNITAFDPRTEIYTRYLHGKEPMIFSDTLKPYWPLIIWYDDYEELFYEVLTLNGTGFLRYDLSSRSFQYYDHNFNEPSNQFPVSANGYFVNGYFFKDHSKTLWYGFRGSLNKEAPPPKKQMTLYQHKKDDPYSLPPTNIRDLFEDSQKRIWVGTSNGGLVRYIPEKDLFQPVKFSPERRTVNEIYEDSEGLIWVATGRGLFLFDESTQTCQIISAIPADSAISNILEDHLHRLWVTVWKDGTYVLDRKTGKVLKKFFPVKEDSTSLLSNQIEILYEDSKGRVWLGDRLNNGLGLFRLNESETGFIHYNSASKASNYISRNDIVFLAEDSENQLWVGTGGELQRYDPINDRFQLYPDPINIPSETAYAVDSEGELWLGTYSGGGLVHINSRTQNSSIYGESKGLLHNDILTSYLSQELAINHQGEIYYPTRRGLSVFDPKTETFQNYFETDGFQPYANFYISLVTRDGDVWIGSENGLNRIQPNQLIEKDTTLPFVHITAVEILDSIYSAPDGKIFKQAVSFTDKIVLSHDQNDLAFEFVALHYAHPEENQYSWKLENRDDEWSKPSLERRVRYANLTPGTYTFRVKASNADGVWNEEGDFIQIVISPPWWTTWWAIAGFVVLFLIFVYVFYRYQLSSRLEHAENLRLKELDSVKSRLYTNITHEFRTPLTVINGMAEQIIEPEESRKMILRNSQHLLRLVNQMLDLAKLESGKLELNLVLGNIIAYLQYLVESFHSFAASKNIELVFYPEMGEFLMDYDEEKLQHIISNLISNAIKFSPEGSK